MKENNVLTYATTFSGVGGWELGLNACGWGLKWQCEKDPFCRRVLTERFGVPIYDDITTLLEHNPPPVDVLVGSPPCQPFSVAGEKRGTSDERHLYPAFIAAVRKLRPRYVLMENVPGLLSNRGAFGQYVGGLAALGFDIVWHSIPACAVGAPHQRDRVWIIANTQRDQQSRTESCVGEIGRMGRQFKPFPWDRDWKDSLSTIRGMGDGISRSVDRTDAIRNAVVPQIPFIIGQAINQIEITLNQKSK